MKRKLRLSEGGFTIVEIITGILVMTVFVIGMGIAVINLTYINDRAYDLVLINALVENKMESLRSAGFGTLEDETIDFSDDLPSSIGAPKSATYTISDQGDSEVGGSLKKVDFTISYTVGRTPQTATYTTYIAELGIGQ
jgi:hypothetical protein